MQPENKKKAAQKRAATNTSIRDFTLHKQCRLSPASAMLPERRKKQHNKAI